jgi:hypothetical protein
MKTMTATSDIDLIDFHRKFIDLTDWVLPALPTPAEKILFLQIFSRTIAAGVNHCTLSYTDLTNITGLARASVKNALVKLQDKGFLLVTKKFDRATASAQSYEIAWPAEPHRLQRHKREGKLMLRSTSAYPYADIIQRLTPGDRELLDMMVKALDSIEEASLRRQAMDNLLPEQSAEEKFLELVAVSKFGPHKLRQYERTSAG